MAGLNTSGFALSALPRAADVPANVGRVDVNAIYDSVVRGMQTTEAMRGALLRQRVADEQAKAAQSLALAQQTVAPEQAAADVATARRTAALASPTLVSQEVAKASTGLDADLAAEQARRDNAQFLTGLSAPQRLVLAAKGPSMGSVGSTTVGPDGQVRAIDEKTAYVGNEAVPLARSETQSPFMLLPGVPSGTREFAYLTAGMTPDQIAQARRVKAGIEGRPSSAGQQSVEVKQPDGSVVRMTFNPRTGKYDLPEIPATPTGGSETVPAVGFRGQTTADAAADKTKAQETEKLKVEKQAALPKAQQAIRDWDTNSNNVIGILNDVSQLASEFSDAGGPLAAIKRKANARVPGTDEYVLQHNINTALANVAFDKLSAMRAQSKTGGALGNVSDKDLQALRDSIASLDLGLPIPQLQANIKNVISRYEQMNQSQHTAFDQEYKDLLDQKSTVTPSVSTQAEYDALPSGALFLTPSGKTRKKP